MVTEQTQISHGGNSVPTPMSHGRSTAGNNVKIGRLLPIINISQPLAGTSFSESGRSIIGRNKY